MRYSVLCFVVSIFVIACGGNGEVSHQNLNEKISYLIEDDRYEVALEELEAENQDDPIVRELLEKTHLNYGLYNMNTFDETEMRTRMNDALRQFAFVLEINPQNDVARNNINQILDIYQTIPNRQPDDDVIDLLQSVGMNSGS